MPHEPNALNHVAREGVLFADAARYSRNNEISNRVVHGYLFAMAVINAKGKAVNSGSVRIRSSEAGDEMAIALAVINDRKHDTLLIMTERWSL